MAGEQVLDVVRGDGLGVEGDALGLGLRASTSATREDGDPPGIDLKMAQQERKHTLADTAEAKHQQTAIQSGKPGVLHAYLP